MRLARANFSPVYYLFTNPVASLLPALLTQWGLKSSGQRMPKIQSRVAAKTDTEPLLAVQGLR